MVFYQGGTIDRSTNVPGPVVQSSSESAYNVACTAGMSLTHFRIINNELMNKYTDVVPEHYPLIRLYSK